VHIAERDSAGELRVVKKACVRGYPGRCLGQAFLHQD